MASKIYAVIMAGGVGSRFWPYSRNARPKQFIDILGNGKSLLQMTYERFLKTTNKDNILVVTNHDYADLVSQQLPEISRDQILTEPDRRNTAPCIAYAAYKIYAQDPDAVMVVTPADHAIFQVDKFSSVINTAVESAAGSNQLITIGIKPTRPETGYGYIQYIDQKESSVLKVKTFTEKPELDLAKKFIESGDFVWNAGIFVWSTQSIVDAFTELLPDIADIFSEGAEIYGTPDERTFIDKIYNQCKSISIDYGILEKSPNVYVVPGDFDWSDLGSWNSLHEMRDKDDRNNVVDGDLILGDCHDNMIKSETKRLIVLDDLDGYLVGDFEDVLIVCKKENEAKFREYVAKVKAAKGDSYL